MDPGAFIVLLDDALFEDLAMSLGVIFVRNSVKSQGITISDLSPYSQAHRITLDTNEIECRDSRFWAVSDS